MSSVRIPLAFYTAVRGYDWHCTNVIFSQADFALIQKQVLACCEIGAIACVFTCGDRAFFVRYFKVENYDSNMRSADYYVVGAVRKYEARNVDFKRVFENEVFASPINREFAFAGKFPSYLDYEGRIATDGRRPSGACPERMEAEALSSIGNWIEQENGNIVVYISDAIANPTVEVKIERKHNESCCFTEGGAANESGAAAYEQIHRQETYKEAQRKEISASGDPNDSGSCGVKSLFNMIGRWLGLWRSPKKDYDAGINDRHDYRIQENRDMTQLGSHGGRSQCPTCNGTGWIYADSSSQLKGP